MSSPEPPSTSFPTGELERALDEQLQSSGISGYKITQSSDLEAIAQVKLLEGNDVAVSLTSSGYALHGGQRELGFETVEDLLRSISAKYSEAMQKALMDKLAALQ
ncbi:hypothetical protein EIP91_001189 [Steccherinum ochraceum]|uniref:GSKIP domain-containing protein n=1 Tax=Steccherinum ochraceum TaxID=92696 RepID=A0A4R0RQ60_9APHY|nr:hypothetical protein EIP91_001189 [Steccherinum ochraceum]